MDQYGKIVDGVLRIAPMSGIVNGVFVINMTPAQHRARGEARIVDSVAPDDAANGWHYVQDGWQLAADGETISPKWSLVADAPKEPVSVSSISDIKATVRKLATLAGLSVSALALCVRAASVDFADLNNINLDSAANVVTNVDFSGLAQQSDVDALSTGVANLWTYVYGDSVWFAVSNYFSTVHVPTLRLMEVRDGATNEVYSSAREIAAAIAPEISAVSNAFTAALDSKPSKAWAKYQSMTGAENPAPEYATVISTPSTLFSGGHEWQKFVDANGAAFLLSGIGGFSSDTDGFAIKSLSGKRFWRISTTSDIVQGAPSTFTGWTNGNFTVTFASPVQPVMYIAETLTNAFVAVSDDPNVSATWTNAGAGNWRVVLNFVDRPKSFFAFAETTITGVEAIIHDVATQLAGGLLVNGVRYNLVIKTIDGQLVLGLEAVDD